MNTPKSEWLQLRKKYGLIANDESELSSTEEYLYITLKQYDLQKEEMEALRIEVDHLRRSNEDIKNQLSEQLVEFDEWLEVINKNVRTIANIFSAMACITILGVIIAILK